MIESKDFRDVVIVRYHNGKNAPEISTVLHNKMHHLTVRRQFNQSGSVNAHKSSRRRRAG